MFALSYSGYLTIIPESVQPKRFCPHPRETVPKVFGEILAEKKSLYDAHTEAKKYFVAVLPPKKGDF